MIDRRDGDAGGVRPAFLQQLIERGESLGLELHGEFGGAFRIRVTHGGELHSFPLLLQFGVDARVVSSEGTNTDDRNSCFFCCAHGLSGICEDDWNLSMEIAVGAALMV